MIKYLKISIFISFLFFVLNTTTKSIESKIIAKVENSVLTSHELKNKIRVTLILSDQEINQNNINNVKSNVLTSLLNLKIKKLLPKSLELQNIILTYLFFLLKI